MPATEDLPVTDTCVPADLAELQSTLHACHASQRAVYPVGGATSLSFGLRARQPGVLLRTTELNAVVDYPAADMTITVQAGIRVAALQTLLAEQGQQLPLDAPNTKDATVGGLLATNTSGPRRYGYGTARDYLIGVHAIDGQGRSFAGGGRVVKNVAGYDFCKLLVGSLGTLGVITEATFKLKPLPQATAYAICRPADFDQADRLLSRVSTSATTPSAVEWLIGPRWRSQGLLNSWSSPQAEDHGGWLVLRFDGSAAEVGWMGDQIRREWSSEPTLAVQIVESLDAGTLWDDLTDFPAEGAAKVVVRVVVVPSAVRRMMEIIRALAPTCSLAAHAGSGVLLASFPDLPDSGVGGMMTRVIHPAAAAADGHACLLVNQADADATRQCTWGSVGDAMDVMRRVKQLFDPNHILNPGRFVF